MTGLPETLAAEHAAIFGYGVVGAHLKRSLRKIGQDAEQAHRELRDAVLQRLTDQSAAPPGAEPAYALPFEVTDSASAVKLAIHLEQRAAAVWRAALAGTKADDRALCLDALVQTSLRATRWREAAGEPPTVAFPGAPR